MLEASVLLVFVAGLLFCLISGLPILLAILFGYLVFFAYGLSRGKRGLPSAGGIACRHPVGKKHPDYLYAHRDADGRMARLRHHRHHHLRVYPCDAARSDGYDLFLALLPDFVSHRHLLRVGSNDGGNLHEHFQRDGASRPV